ncbi:MAG: hypothetical protein D6B26_06175 [Spirochaetaceae bacterium]|nr:MAG: hypothetical protein D6B26_06175 [Spirochaetaceae bacterium]
MRKTTTFVLLILMSVLFLSSCSTLSVKIPSGTYISSGDYVENVRTKGIIQVYERVWTPFFVLYDASKVRENLYKKLIEEAREMRGIDGVTNVTFYSKPSPWSVLMPVTFGIGVWVDHYAEGVAIAVTQTEE